MPCPMCGSEIDGSHKFGCVNYVGTHDEVDRMLSDEQLNSIRKKMRARALKLPDEGIHEDARVEAFMAGALFFRETIQGHYLTIQVDEDALYEAARYFYPSYDDLPEPTKANESGNAPPLAIPRK